MNQKYGTPYYIAPEVLKRHYDEKCDIWSCGVILYVLLCGYPPFNGANDKEIMEKVEKGEYKLYGAEWEHVSEEAKIFLRDLLEVEPERRLTAEQAFNHAWIQKVYLIQEIEKPVVLSAVKNLKSFRVIIGIFLNISF
jgi:calcium-dependent protein kinase